MKPWTVLVYLAGDNGRFLSSLEGEGYADLAEMKEVGSGDALDIVAQFDAMSDRACRRYHITRGGALRDDQVLDLGNTNSGDPAVLLDFITWGVRTHPAEHYLLVLWNHGSGWKDDDIYAPYRSLLRRGNLPQQPPHIAGRRVARALFRRTLETLVQEEANQVVLAQTARLRGSAAGAGAAQEWTGSLPPGWLRPGDAETPVLRGQPARATIEAVRASKKPHLRAICFDDSSKDFLDSRDLSAVLAAARSLIGRKIDLLGFDACLMSMIEVAYQVREGASYMAASEDSEPGDGWPYGRILRTLAEQPALSPAELGKIIVQHYVDSYDASLLSGLPVTQAALDLGQAKAAVAAVDGLARGLLAGWRGRALRSALAEARAQTQTFMDPDYVDLHDFVSLLAGKPSARAVHDACAAVLAALEPGAEGSLVLADGHAGLSERNAHGLSIYFPMVGVSPCYAALEMSADCAWAEFLESVHG